MTIYEYIHQETIYLLHIISYTIKLLLVIVSFYHIIHLISIIIFNYSRRVYLLTLNFKLNNVLFYFILYYHMFIYPIRFIYLSINIPI